MFSTTGERSLQSTGKEVGDDHGGAAVRPGAQRSPGAGRLLDQLRQLLEGSPSARSVSSRRWFGRDPAGPLLGRDRGSGRAVDGRPRCRELPPCPPQVQRHGSCSGRRDPGGRQQLCRLRPQSGHARAAPSADCPPRRHARGRGARRQPLAGSARRTPAGAPVLQRPRPPGLLRGPSRRGRNAASPRSAAADLDHQHQGHDLPAGRPPRRHALAHGVARLRRHGHPPRHRPPLRARDLAGTPLVRPPVVVGGIGQRAPVVDDGDLAGPNPHPVAPGHGRAARRRLDPVVPRAP